MNKFEEDKQFVQSTLKSLMAPPHWLDGVLHKYDTEVKDRTDRVGICHEIAVAILRDLHEKGTADGWSWCRGMVDNGIEHSWAEYGGLGVDMGDNHRLRIWSTDKRPFTVDGEFVRRNGAETDQWAKEWDIQSAAAVREQGD